MKFEHLQAEKSSDYKHLCVLLKIFIFAVFDPKWRLLKERQKKTKYLKPFNFPAGISACSDSIAKESQSRDAMMIIPR